MSDDGDLNVQREIEIDKQLAKWHNAAFAGIELHGLREAMAPGLAEYVTDGVPPGSFLCAVIQNDLMAAAHDDARLIMATDPELTKPRGQALRVLLYLSERDAAIQNFPSG